MEVTAAQECSNRIGSVVAGMAEVSAGGTSVAFRLGIVGIVGVVGGFGV